MLSFTICGIDDDGNSKYQGKDKVLEDVERPPESIAGDGSPKDENRDKPVVTLSQVQRLIDVSLAAHYQPPPVGPRACNRCKASFDRSHFCGRQWSAPDATRTCLTCKPVEEKFLKSRKMDRDCAACGMKISKDQFSVSQLNEGAKAKCIACINAKTVASKKLARYCTRCLTWKPLDEFSPAQKNKKVSEMKCIECCSVKVKASQFRRHDEDNVRVQGDAGCSSAGQDEEVCASSSQRAHLWEETTRDAAMRWVMSATEKENCSVLFIQTLVRLEPSSLPLLCLDLSLLFLNTCFESVHGPPSPRHSMVLANKKNMFTRICHLNMRNLIRQSWHFKGEVMLGKCS